MPVNVVITPVGESITEGTIARWLKKTGDYVRTGDALLELETEKATPEIYSQASGTLKITVAEGEKVVIGAVVGSIDETAAAPAATKAEAAKIPIAQPVAKADVLTTPAAGAIIAQQGLQAGAIAGTGRHGVIQKADVQGHLEQSNGAKPAVPAGPRSERREKMSAIRQRIAERLLTSQKTTASLTTFNEVDMSAVMDLRAKYKESFQKKHGVNLGFMSFFVKSVVEALKAFPIVNARIDGAEIVVPSYYDVGVAVSTEKGLMVPVLRDADKLTFAQVEKTITELALKARDGKISVADLQGGTFTITNGGIFGSMMSTPILNPPQSAILGMHAITKRAVVRDDQIVIRPMMYLAVTYDHRIVDGRDAVQFLVRIKDCLESPERLLLEI